MPIPTPESGQTEREYISACISEIYPEYDVEGQAYAICQSTWDKENMKSEDFSRTKFELPCNHREKMPEYMARCMSNNLVRERYQERSRRAGFCYSQYQNRYINSIGKNWK